MAELKTLTLNGTTYDSFAGAEGKDGKTPVKGTDYWTDEDKAEIVDEVLAQVPSGGGSENDVFITVEDIDAICGASISMASEVLF